MKINCQKLFYSINARNRSDKIRNMNSLTATPFQTELTELEDYGKRLIFSVNKYPNDTYVDADITTNVQNVTLPWDNNTYVFVEHLFDQTYQDVDDQVTMSRTIAIY